MDSKMLVQYDNKVTMYHNSANLIHTQF